MAQVRLIDVDEATGLREGGARGRGRPCRHGLDAIQVIASFNHLNRVAGGIGIGPEPEWTTEGSGR